MTPDTRSVVTGVQPAPLGSGEADASRTVARTDRRVVAVSAALGAIGSVGYIVGRLSAPGGGPWAHLVLTTALFTAIFVYVQRGGDVRRAGTWALVVAAVLTVGDTLLADGIWHGALPYLALGTAVSAAVLGPRAGRRFLALSIASALFAAYGQTQGWSVVTGQPHPERLWTDVADHVAVSVVLAVVVFGLVGRARAAERRAAAELELKSRFIRVMCHQIRTPLNGVLGMTQALGASLGGSAARPLVETLDRASRALITLFDDILDYSQAETRELHLSPRAVELGALLDDVARLFATTAQERGLALRVEREGPARVLVDPGRLRQVVTNLVSNALKFTTRGEVVLRVASTGPRRWRITVRDTGPGIATDDLARLFHPFSQVGEATERTRGGAGLGLAISRQVVEALGGTLSVESTPGAGASFFVDLALDPAPHEVTQELPAAPRALSGRALVVEDNRVNQRVVAWMLERLGVEATIVETAELGLERLAAEPFDVVLMDVQLPGMDGLSATREIVRTYGTRIPVVGLSAHALDRDLAKAYAAGMVEYVTKPVDLAALRAALTRANSGPARPETIGPQRPVVPPETIERQQTLQLAFTLTSVFAVAYCVIPYVSSERLNLRALTLLAALPLLRRFAADPTRVQRATDLFVTLCAATMLSGPFEAPDYWQASMLLISVIGPLAVVLHASHPVAWSMASVLASPLVALAHAEGLTGTPGVHAPLYIPVLDFVVAATMTNVLLARCVRELEGRERRLREEARERLRFLASLGHEIRTPMNGVLGSSELLVEHAVERQAADQLATLRGSAVELLRIVDQLIDFVRLEEGRLELHPVDLELAATLRAAIEAARLEVASADDPSFAERPVRLAIEPGVPARVHGDAARLRQAVRALVSNGLRFGGASGTSVRVRPGTAGLTIVVEDRGVGMTPDAQRRALEPFHADRSARGLGIGLGLPTVALLAARMGGRFALRSALGEGTSAELSIPLGPATGAGARVRAVQSLQLARGDRVLVVDDDATNRHVASLMLARLGLSADLAATGEDALAQSASGAHALVLLDLGLPDLDGVEVARALRAREAPGAPVPLYALTGCDDPVERAAALAAGVDGILDKPLRLDALRALVGDDLGAPSPAPSLAPPATLDLDRPRDQAAPH